MRAFYLTTYPVPQRCNLNRNLNVFLPIKSFYEMSCSVGKTKVSGSNYNIFMFYFLLIQWNNLST